MTRAASIGPACHDKPLIHAPGVETNIAPAALQLDWDVIQSSFYSLDEIPVNANVLSPKTLPQRLYKLVLSIQLNFQNSSCLFHFDHCLEIRSKVTLRYYQSCFISTLYVI